MNSVGVTNYTVIAKLRSRSHRNLTLAAKRVILLLLWLFLFPYFFFVCLVCLDMTIQMKAIRYFSHVFCSTCSFMPYKVVQTII